VTGGATGRAPGGLIPVADRIRWLLMCRAGLVAVLLGMRMTATGARVGVVPLAVAVLGWLALTSATLPAGRRNRFAARFLLNVSLLGDGMLLAISWWALGGLDGPVGSLVVLHSVAVTLLASFRTGTKIALWHSVLALLVLQAKASGLLGAAVAMPDGRFGGYLGSLWVTVLATASFAAMNERELRRRRYDSEVLRAFGLAVAPEQDPARIAMMLATFARDELQASRSAVVVQPHESVRPGADGAFAAVIDTGGTGAIHRRPPMPPAMSPAATAGPPATKLRRSLDPVRHPWLVELMPRARNVIEVPFSTGEVSGVFVVEHPRRSAQRSSRRVEQRAVNTAEQAAAHAAVAIGRAILTDRIRTAADTDGLTGVANRRRFDAVLAGALEQGSPVALLLIDLDHFKRLNDGHGHLAGDEVLRRSAEAIASVCRERGLVARYGGEEFGVILTGAEAATAPQAAELIRDAVSGVPGPVTVTASIGVAACPPHEPTAARLIAGADAALYAAKRTGRNRVVVGTGSADRPAPILEYGGNRPM